MGRHKEMDHLHVLKSNVEKKTKIMKYFQCHLCQKEFQTKGGLAAHIRVHTGEKLYSCDICGESFAYGERLERHKTTHTDEKPFQCSICSKNCATKETLRDHVMTHTGEKRFFCAVCGKGFIKKADLNKHQPVHLDIKERPFKCSKCPMGYNDKRLLKQHLMRHKDEKPHQCDVCGEAFFRADGLRKHRMKHTGEKPHHCSVCQKSFRFKNVLLRHIQTHTSEKPFQCDICGLKLKCKNSVKIHKRTHNNIKQFKCTLCTDAFRTKEGLATHIMKHRGKKTFKCNICGKGFFTNYLFKRHLIRHKDASTPDASKPYVCKRCRDYFATDEELKKHFISEHYGDRLYQCKQCNSAFATTANYRRHIKLHIGRKPYECNVCRKRFPERYKLENHVVRHTGFEDIVKQQMETLKMERQKFKSHEDDRSYQCTVCGKRFKKMPFLMKHTKYHSEERPYRCIPCGKGFVEKYHLKRHMKVQHCLEEDMFEELIIKKQFVRIVTDSSDQQSKDDEMIYDNIEKADDEISFDYRGTKMSNKGAYNLEKTLVWCDQNSHFGHQFPVDISDATIDMVPLKEQGARTILFERDVQYVVGKKNKKSNKIVSVRGREGFFSKNNTADMYEQIHCKSENQSLTTDNEDIIGQEIVLESDIEENIGCNDGETPMSSGGDVNNCKSSKKCNAEQFRCIACGQTFSNPDNLMEHAVKDMQNALLTCNVCGIVCISANALEDHKLTHTDQMIQSGSNQIDQTLSGSCYLSMFT